MTPLTGDQMTRSVTLNKITDLFGFEHFQKHL